MVHWCFSGSVCVVCFSGGLVVHWCFSLVVCALEED